MRARAPWNSEPREARTRPWCTRERTIPFGAVPSRVQPLHCVAFPALAGLLASPVDGAAYGRPVLSFLWSKRLFGPTLPEKGSNEKMGQSANVVFESTTNAIIEAIEKGAEEWCMPWSTERFEFPSNPVTRKRYRGGNVLTLVGESLVATYSSGEWATYRQWTTVGAQVRKGERGTACIWWHVPKPVEQRDDVADAPRTGFFPRTFVVFNAAQVDDYSATPSLRNSPQQLVTADTFFANVDANVEHRSLGCAFYSPDRDLIVLPQFDRLSTRRAITRRARMSMLIGLVTPTG